MLSRILLIGMLMSLAACSAPESGSDSQAAAEAEGQVTHDLVGTRWALVQLEDKAVMVSDGGREPYVALNSVETRVVGFGGCNRISSTYELNGARLRFGEVIATRMFCDDMPIETALLDAMKATAGWRISGSRLELLDANQQPLASFEAKNL
jgi:heat shock protein HslJ